jgi:hypothetical protein
MDSFEERFSTDVTNFSNEFSNNVEWMAPYSARLHWAASWDVSLG